MLLGVWMGSFGRDPLLEINRTAVTVFTAGSLFNKGICQFVISVYTSGVIVFLTFEFLIIRPTVRKKKKKKLYRFQWRENPFARHKLCGDVVHISGDYRHKKREEGVDNWMI